MEWIIASSLWRWRIGLGIIGGALIAGFLWWALADLFLATFELPAERWRKRGARPHDDRNGHGAGAPLVA